MPVGKKMAKGNSNQVEVYQIGKVKLDMFHQAKLRHQAIQR
jgi:hypothetical protein